MPAIEIKAVDVQKLRQMTGAGLMDCKKALTEAGGNIEKAIQHLREQGIAKSSKRADRLAGGAQLPCHFERDDSTERGAHEMVRPARLH